MALEAFGDSKIMNGQVTLWQVVAAYVFALAGVSISTSLHLAHKPFCALISFAAGTLLGVTLFAILPESLGDSPWWAVALAAATGYVLFFFISQCVHHVCPACAASHFDADATRHFSEIATALIVALAIHSTTDGLAVGSLLIGAGLQRSGALGWVASVEATTLLGGVIGYFFLAKVSTFWLGLIMAHVGGGFFYLAAHALLGELIKHGKALVLTSFSAGLALIGILNICLRMLG